MTGTGSDFGSFAGNAFNASGIGTTIPRQALEAIQSPTVASNLRVLDALLPAKGDHIFLEPRIFDGKFGWIQRSDLPFGGFAEIAQIRNAPPIKKRDGKCMSFGTAEVYAEQYVSNFAYHIPITIKDKEIDEAVLSQGAAEAYISNKLGSPLQTMALERYAAWKNLFADVTDGTRTYTSSANSDGTGDPADYSVTVEGYAGKVETCEAAVPALTVGSQAAIGTETTADADTLKILNMLKNAAAWMRYPTNDYARGLTQDTDLTFAPAGGLTLIMETAVLDAMDSAWAMSKDYKGLSMTARQYVASFLNGGRLEEIDRWPDLPTSDATSGKRLLAVLIDSQAPREFIRWENVEAGRCMQERSTTYDYQGEGIRAIYKGLPSYALLAPTSSS